VAGRAQSLGTLEELAEQKPESDTYEEHLKRVRDAMAALVSPEDGRQ
jgi:hypothetical protein